MDIKQLRFLVNVIDHGSFTKAARVLAVAQSVISHHVSELEKNLGQQLLVRHGRGVIPTEAGTRLAEHARGILHQLATAQAELAALRGNPAGRVAIGLGSRLGRLLSAPLIMEFRESNPGITLDFNEMPSLNIAEWLEMGRLDMGLMYPPADFDKFPFRKIMDIDLCLVSRLSDPDESWSPTIPFAQVAGVPLLLPESRNNFLLGGWSPAAGAARLMVENAAAEAGISLNVAGEFNEGAGVAISLDLVRGGQGSTILPFHLVSGADSMPSRDFKVQFIVSPSLYCPLSVVFPRHRPINRAAHVVAGAIETFMIRRVAEIRQQRLGTAP